MQATAFVAAAARAAETAKPRGRVRDEYARLFVDVQRQRQNVRRRLLAAGTDEVVYRTAILDALLTTTTSGHTGYAVLNLGAGFCARPYRLELSTCATYIEVDAPDVVELKAEVLAPFDSRCPVTRVPGDVRDVATLRRVSVEHGLADRRTIVMSEGLLVYLPPEQVTELASGLAGVLRDARWLCDIVSVDSAAGMNTVASGAKADVRLHGLSDLETLQSGGWTVSEYRPLPISRRSPVAGGSRDVVDGVLALDLSIMD
ncbi:hypothetical protein STSO111631_18745 [Stackebrandtia soli]